MIKNIISDMFAMIPMHISLVLKFSKNRNKKNFWALCDAPYRKPKLKTHDKIKDQVSYFGLIF